MSSKLKYFVAVGLVLSICLFGLSLGQATYKPLVYIESTQAPTKVNDPGVKGEVRYDNDYLYICVGTDTWKRAKLTSW